MLTLFAIRQFGRALRYAFKDPVFRFLAVVVAAVLVAGMTLFHLIEGWRWLDSLYFSVMTLATVGFGDFVPKTDLGKILTMLYVFFGIGMLVAIFTRLSDALLAAQREVLEKRKQK